MDFVTGFLLGFICGAIGLIALALMFRDKK